MFLFSNVNELKNWRKKEYRIDGEKYTILSHSHNRYDIIKREMDTVYEYEFFFVLVEWRWILLMLKHIYMALCLYAICPVARTNTDEYAKENENEKANSTSENIKYHYTFNWCQKTLRDLFSEFNGSCTYVGLCFYICIN